MNKETNPKKDEDMIRHILDRNTAIKLLRKDRVKDRFAHKPMSRKKKFFMMTFAAILMANGTHFFKYPNNFVIGGVEGASILISNSLPVTPAFTTLILNISLLVLAYFILGKNFVFKTGYVSILNSLTAIVLDKIFPLQSTLTDNKLLELFCAVLIPALGSSILFNLSASSGGTDIIAMIINKYLNMNIGKSLLMGDSILTILSIKIFGIEIGLLSCLGLLMKGVVVNEFISSFNTAKLFLIITNKQDEISEFIRDKLNRSATVIDGKGLYFKKDQSIFLCVTNDYEAVLFRRFIKEIDPCCFITVIDTSSIIGKGWYSTDLH
ncbi:YitT family protein [Anaerococcus sp. AGMB00486]|uniref:YitT family protein n=2 Tax=Anaerococcus TaxID=165779 RepID=A0ABX2NBF0_9FIRM|nr:MULTISPECIES: YitT family protein [Anaerococcus]MDY3005600.1 YitT family protein [Anaerococcus porci]MSS78144.1 YitT family protein [Anaerococcus porci]NVF12052.1 YitT family protein [Anaerococcus faecalis]